MYGVFPLQWITTQLERKHAMAKIGYSIQGLAIIIVVSNVKDTVANLMANLARLSVPLHFELNKLNGVVAALHSAVTTCTQVL